MGNFPENKVDPTILRLEIALNNARDRERQLLDRIKYLESLLPNHKN